MTIERQHQRQRLQAKRRALTRHERQAAALSVARQVADWRAYREAVRLAGYWACNGELEPMPLLERAWTAGKVIYLPVLVDIPPRSLRFAPYWPDSTLRRNRFNIPEPDVPPAEWLQAEQLDLVLTPLLAFDAAGTRLGMGGGFYDRCFAFLLDPSHQGNRPWLLGLGYEFQKIPGLLIRESWDVPLDAAATEDALYVFGSNKGGGQDDKVC